MGLDDRDNAKRWAVLLGCVGGSIPVAAGIAAAMHFGLGTPWWPAFLSGFSVCAMIGMVVMIGWKAIENSPITKRRKARRLEAEALDPYRKRGGPPPGGLNPGSSTPSSSPTSGSGNDTDDGANGEPGKDDA